MNVDQILDREARVDEELHRFVALAVHLRSDPVPVVGHQVEHLPFGMAEPGAVLEEVAVAVDVRHHELLVHDRVALEEIGVAGVVVDHHLVDLLQTIRVALRELLVLHPEPPVRIARREAAVGGHLVHLLVGQDLEDRLEEVAAVLAGARLDQVLPVAQFGGKIAAHPDCRHLLPRERRLPADRRARILLLWMQERARGCNRLRPSPDYS